MNATAVKADRPDEETRRLRLALYPLGCMPLERPDGGWNVYHRGVLLGVIRPGGVKASHPWFAEPAVTEPDLPPYCRPRRSVEQAVIALLNRHYRLRDADRRRAVSQQDA